MDFKTTRYLHFWKVHPRSLLIRHRSPSINRRDNNNTWLAFCELFTVIWELGRNKLLEGWASVQCWEEGISLSTSQFPPKTHDVLELRMMVCTYRALSGPGWECPWWWSSCSSSCFYLTFLLDSEAWMWTLRDGGGTHFVSTQYLNFIFTMKTAEIAQSRWVTHHNKMKPKTAYWKTSFSEGFSKSMFKLWTRIPIRLSLHAHTCTHIHTHTLPSRGSSSAAFISWNFWVNWKFFSSVCACVYACLCQVPFPLISHHICRGSKQLDMRHAFKISRRLWLVIKQ